MKKEIALLLAAAGVLMMPPMADAEGDVTVAFNPENVILPSSQYTPEEPYAASVWVFNDGRRYEERYYNQILGTPPSDASGRQWYEPGYELTDGNGAGWQTATAPFSSDEYYKGAKSFRWVEAEIMGEIYMRRTFSLTSLPDGPVYLSCGHDDAPSEWYINGRLVHSVADGWNNDEYCLLADEDKACIRTDGIENVIAVHVHQNWGGAFADCGLYEADMTSRRTLLPTVAGGDWPCLYYLLNYNSDLELAEQCGWASPEEDEYDWMSGVGPFSRDANMFYTTEWASHVRPILVRRHFILTADDISSIKEGGRLEMVCSYDENPKVYLNGVMIWSTSGWNDNDYFTYTLSDEQTELLAEGDNVLAVSLMQGDGGGHIDYGLQLVSRHGESGVVAPEADRPGLCDGRIFDLQGRYVGSDTETLSRGIYIRNGKKLVVGAD